MNNDVENFERENVVYINDVLILKFLKVFSRAEYALKMSNKFCHNNKAEANWDLFGNKINNDFLNINDCCLSRAKEYLWNKPPKKQKINNSNLIFSDFVIDSNAKKTQQLLLMVRTVRNNLFHGGKHTLENAEVNNTERNQKLIESSIVIIKACMKLNDDVSEYYKGK